MCNWIYKKLLAQYSTEDILVLSAFNKGDCGTIAINNAIQKIANHNYGSEKCIKSGDTTYYVDDIVIQIKNNYEAEVDMGDMKIENANPREYSVDTTFIPNGMLGKIVDIYDETIPYTNEHKTGAIIDFDGVRVNRATKKKENFKRNTFLLVVLKKIKIKLNKKENK